MRLTLRTLLAYMDDILEPADSQDIGQKIQESEFATGLLHRTRDVMRRMRLSAPDVWDHGETLNCNTVAEYLDNTLSNERVPDFEKVCLESDVHLAEVACCHQILTLVLGEPAEVDPVSRQRMYQIPTQAAAEAPASADETAVAAGPRPRSKPMVPDYLREQRPRRSWMPALTGVILTAFFALVVLAALGQFEPGAPLANLLGIKPEVDDQLVAVEDAPEAQVAPDEETKPVVDDETPNATGPQDQDETPTDEPGRAEDPSAQPQEDATQGELPDSAEPEVAPEPPLPADTTSEVAGDPMAETAGDRSPAEPPTPVRVEPSEPVGSETAADVPPTVNPTRPPMEPNESPTEPEESAPLPSDARPPTEAVASNEPRGSAEGPPEMSGASASAAENVGRFVSDRDVLLRLNSETSTWERVPANDLLSPGRPLVALPTYRPLVALTAGVTIQVVGGSQIELLPSDEAGVPGIIVDYGRLVVRTVGQAESRLRLRTGEQEGMITLVSAESSVAIEVGREVPPAVDPAEEPLDPTTRMYALSGQIRWRGSDQADPVTVEAPQILTLKGAETLTSEKSADGPDWALSSTVGPLDRRASPTVEAALVKGRPAGLSLRELSVHRQKEVRWLAVRCLGYLGEFGPLVTMFNDPSQKLLWPNYLEHLRDAIGRGQNSAAALKRALSREYQQAGDILYRMLLGYTDEQFRSAEAARLIESLDHDTLAVRVVAFLTLEEITGLRLYYEPEASAAKRAAPVRKWKERLDSGELYQREPPSSSAATPEADEESDAPAAPLPEDVR